MKECYLCTGAVQVIKDQPYTYTECGLNVNIHGLTQYKCEECGETYVSLPNIQKLHRVIGGHICEHRKSLLTPEEIKFLRKDLHLKAKDLSRVLGVTPQTISRWENGKKPIGETQDRLLRAIYLMYASEKEDHVACHGVIGVFSSLPQKRKEIKIEKAIAINPPEWLTGKLELCDA